MMARQQCGSHTIKTHGGALARAHLFDWLFLFILLAIIGILNYIEPFHRYVGKDMMTDLKYPFKHDTIPMWAVPVYGIMFPCVVFLLYYVKKRNVYDLHHATLGLFYAVLITGVITDAIKDAVGRPRPNFFFRCFPDGVAVFDATTMDVACTNPLLKVIKEGYKSFPSGHTSWSFAGLGYLSCYLSGKIRVFDRKGCVAKLCIVLLPYLAAALVGVTRVDDYWHHWTDVFTGAITGTVVSTLCYLHFFPYPHDTNGWGPHAYFKVLAEINEGEPHASGARNGMTNEDCETPPV